MRSWITTIIVLISLVFGSSCEKNRSSKASSPMVEDAAATASNDSLISGSSSKGFDELLSNPKLIDKTQTQEYKGKGYTCYHRYLGNPLNTEIVYAVVDDEILVPGIVSIGSQVPNGKSAENVIQEDESVVITIAGGFVKTFFPPTPQGLLVANGKEINHLFISKSRDSYKHIVFSRGKTIEFTDTSNYSPKGVKWAIQTGPGLISNGIVGIGKDEPSKVPAATRGFIGNRRDGKIIIGITLREVHLFHLSQYLQKSINDGGLNCYNAVNLSGGGSESIAFKSNNTPQPILFGNHSLNQASIIAFRAAENSARVVEK